MITCVEPIVITRLLCVRLYARPSTDIRRWRIDFKISELVVGELTRWRNDRNSALSVKKWRMKILPKTLVQMTNKEIGVSMWAHNTMLLHKVPLYIDFHFNDDSYKVFLPSLSLCSI